MSNYLAIATVTAALQRTLQAAIQIDVDGARVTTVRPDSMGGGTPETGINLYLYHVAPNPAWRNADIATRNLDGQLIKRPQQVALDIDYLISCYGNEVELEPQRLLGSVVRILHARPIITRRMIQETIGDAAFSFLGASNLVDQVEVVKLMPLGLSLEELSNLWSMFGQTPHALSVAYQGTVVLIDTDEPIQKALPVRQRKFYVSPTQPIVQQVLSQAGALQPIDRESTLIVRGQRLEGDSTHIRIGEAEASPQKISATELTVPLASLPADRLRAGVQSLQVIQRSPISTPSIPNRGVESNLAAFVLRPTVIEAQVSQLEGSGDDLRSAQVTLMVEPAIGKAQRVALILNERSGTDPTAYTFDAKLRDADSQILTIAIHDVKAGEYLVRLQVDNAESLLTVDGDPDSPTFEQYIAPKITID